ncbi:Noc2l protein [Pelomyxa schiedti]|nr:Noc2l protein [Pelomyxa schiedti]
MVKKSTKKFQTKHLQHRLQQRNEYQKKAKFFTKKPKRLSDGTAVLKGAAPTKTTQAEPKPSKVDDLPDDFGAEKNQVLDDDSEISDISDDDVYDLNELSSAVGDGEIDSATSKSIKNDAASLGSNQEVQELKGKVTKHSSQLEELKEADPEFFAYLQKTDPNLLNFEGGDSNDEGDDEEDQSDEDKEEEEGEEEEEEDSDDKSKPGKEKGAKEKKIKGEETNKPQRVITIPVITKWVDIALAKHSVMSLKILSAMFHVGCNISNEKLQYRIPSSEVYDKLMVSCLRVIPTLLNKLLPSPPCVLVGGDSASSSGSIGGWLVRNYEEILKKNPRWESLSDILKRLLADFVALLGQLTEKSMLVFTLNCLESVVVYFSCYAGSARKILKTLLQHWSTGERDVQLAAFTNILKMSVCCPHPFLDIVLKATYLTLVRVTQHFTAADSQRVVFMTNSIIELCGIDLACTYQHMFIYVRQLAIHLRNAVMHKEGTEAVLKKSVHNWQYVHSLNVWVEVLRAFSAQDPIKHLVYPVIQIIMGLLEHANSNKQMPMRFVCTRMLLNLCAATGIFANPLPFLLECIQHPDVIKSSPKRGQPIDWEHTLTLSEGTLGSRIVAEGVIEQVHTLILQFLSMHSTSIAFPEIAMPCVVFLRRFKKHCGNPAMAKELGTLLEKIEENMKLVLSKRGNVEYGPQDTEKAKAFMQEEKDKKSTPLHLAFDKFLKHKQLTDARLHSSNKRNENEQGAEEKGNKARNKPRPKKGAQKGGKPRGGKAGGVKPIVKPGKNIKLPPMTKKNKPTRGDTDTNNKKKLLPRKRAGPNVKHTNPKGSKQKRLG